MLDCVIPMVMQVIHDHDGYVEKNTGDGVMAVFGVDEADQGANAALDAALTIFYVQKVLVNPYLAGLGIPPVAARIGIDLGPLLLARIGVASGTARQQRNFLTAVGPAAKCGLQVQTIGQHKSDLDRRFGEALLHGPLGVAVCRSHAGRVELGVRRERRAVPRMAF